jgi:hypothetical protein
MAVKLTRILVELQVDIEDDDTIRRVASSLATACAHDLEDMGVSHINTELRVVQETFDDDGEEEIAPMRVIINGPAGDGCNTPE